MNTTGRDLGSGVDGRQGPLHREKSATRDRLRVAKKLLPGQPGSLKLTRKYGEALVCVRYRHDAQGLSRYTTVELIVEQVPVVPRIDRVVGVRVHYAEAALQGTIKANGAKWDSAAKLWRMPHRAAVKLGLQSRIVEK